MEILRLLSDWFAVLEERGTVPGTTLGTMVFAISTLEDSLCGMSPVLSICPPLARLMSFSGGKGAHDAASFVRRPPRLVYIVFYV